MVDVVPREPGLALASIEIGTVGMEIKSLLTARIVAFFVSAGVDCCWSAGVTIAADVDPEPVTGVIIEEMPEVGDVITALGVLFDAAAMAGDAGPPGMALMVSVAPAPTVNVPVTMEFTVILPALMVVFASLTAVILACSGVVLSKAPVRAGRRLRRRFRLCTRWPVACH